MADEVKIIVDTELDSSGAKKGLDNAEKELQQEANSKPVKLKLGIDKASQDEMLGILSKNIDEVNEGITDVGKKFNLVKTEFNKIESGKFKGLIRAVETFSNGLGETKNRVTVFQQATDEAFQQTLQSFEVANQQMKKAIVNELNYQQGMELTAKKLSVLNKEVSKSPIYDKNGILKGWETTTTALMSSGQELQTIVRETQDAGIYTKETSQKIRKWNDDFTELKTNYEQFGEKSVETINLRQQAEEKYLNTLLKEKKVIEEFHTFESTDRTGELTGVKGTKYQSTWKTTEDQYHTKYQTITKKWQDELGNTIEVTSQRIKEQGKAWSKLEEISRKVHSNEIEDAKRQQAEQERLNKTIRNKETLTNSYTKTIKGVSHQIQEESTVTEDYAGNLKKVSKETDTFTDSQGRLVTTITSVNAEGQRTTETLIKMGNSAKHLSQSFSDVIVKVAKFYVASLPIRAVQKAITDAVQSVKDFDSAITEFRKVSDLSGKSLDEYCDKLERLGELTARTRKHSVRERIVICV